MPFISEIVYKDSGPQPEYAEAALTQAEKDALDGGTLTAELAFYESDGTFAGSTDLSTVTPVQDPASGLWVYQVDQLISAPDAPGSVEAVALVVDGTTEQFFSVDGGTEPITAVDGPATGTSVTVPAVSGDDAIQFRPDGTTFFSAPTSGEAVCFLAGTRIATPDGEVAVEDLGTGDSVATADGRIVPVKWIGRQSVSTRFGPAERLMPVRVMAGALGDGTPVRDLVLTADHALMIDGVLVNASALVNGTTINWDPLSGYGDGYTVYHVETEDHDLILAEGAPAETYVDYVQRSAFDNYAEYVALYGEDRTIREMPCPRVSSARHLPPVLAARLAGRAVA